MNNISIIIVNFEIYCGKNNRRFIYNKYKNMQLYDILYPRVKTGMYYK